MSQGELLGPYFASGQYTCARTCPSFTAGRARPTRPAQPYSCSNLAHICQPKEASTWSDKGLDGAQGGRVLAQQLRGRPGEPPLSRKLMFSPGSVG